MKAKGLVFFATVVATALGLFGMSSASAADIVAVTRAVQVTPGDGQIAAHGTYAVGAPNMLMRIDVTATKTDAPNIGQKNFIQAGLDPGSPKTDWAATILVAAGTWDVTAKISTMNPTTHLVTFTDSTVNVTGVVVK